MAGEHSSSSATFADWGMCQSLADEVDIFGTVIYCKSY